MTSIASAIVFAAIFIGLCMPSRSDFRDVAKALERIADEMEKARKGRIA